jgi:predicted DCC family thiol-disulfide oxidoreductase YuxK
MSQQQVTTCVFYDGGCPLCHREIKHYKKLAEKDGAEIDWVDISTSQVELKAEGIKYKDAMKLIHIKDGSGVHQVGIEGLFTLWDLLPYYRRFSYLLQRATFLHPLLSKSYAFFAKLRLKLPRRQSKLGARNEQS